MVRGERREHGDEAHRFEHHGPLGTVLSIAVTTRSGPAEAAAIDAVVCSEIARLEATFSVYDSTSELCRWRAGKLDECSAELTRVLSVTLDWQRRSGGAFNPLATVVTDRWARAARSGVRPTDGELAQLAASIAEPAFQIENGVVRRLGDCAGVTLNAIAKGAIVDVAVERAMQRFDPTALTVSAGGDVLHHGAEPTVVGVENPLRPYDNEPPLLRFELSAGAVATSGGARRGVRVGGEWVSHVIDPRTGRPADSIASASAVAVDVATADVVATICTVLPPDESISWLRSVPEAEVLLVGNDGEVIESPGFWSWVRPVSGASTR